MNTVFLIVIVALSEWARYLIGRIRISNLLNISENLEDNFEWSALTLLSTDWFPPIYGYVVWEYDALTLQFCRRQLVKSNITSPDPVASCTHETRNVQFRKESSENLVKIMHRTDTAGL